MNIHNAKIAVSAVSPKQYPKTIVPEFAFAGRSNVGKSSLINKLLNRKSLARVSGVPGKTITINFYDIDETIFLVDLPGYGYAKRSRSDVKEWGDMIESYLAARPQLKTIFLLVDSRHEPTKDDIMMLEWIRTVRYGEPVVVIATKTDKLNKSQIEPNLERIYEKLELTEEDVLVPFSTKGDEGKETVWDIINLLK
ncbi:MAG: ribosome biogenesis GTP-binding protein YihA/YsxC [Clostridia bacterium]|nr:ribosome biogenesis GTP-binding protein YihA/YsxC [Clostridia bacterium]